MKKIARDHIIINLKSAGMMGIICAALLYVFDKADISMTYFLPTAFIIGIFRFVSTLSDKEDAKTRRLVEFLYKLEKEGLIEKSVD